MKKEETQNASSATAVNTPNDSKSTKNEEDNVQVADKNEDHTVQAAKCMNLYQLTSHLFYSSISDSTINCYGVIQVILILYIYLCRFHRVATKSVKAGKIRESCFHSGEIKGKRKIL